MAVYQDPKLYGLETMTLDQQVEHLTELCKQERARGLARHWTYEPARHREYYAMWQSAVSRRHIEEIDQAFERAGQRILEAAE